jgi:hypothetical protein
MGIAAQPCAAEKGVAMRAGSLPLLLLAPALLAAPGIAATPPAQLAGDLSHLLDICHVRDPARSSLISRQEVRGAYGRIAIATANHPCELSFELESGTMADVQRIVNRWVRANDAAPTFRDPRAVGGRKAIWALRRSTLRLESDAEPRRGTLIVSYFPSR